SYLKTPGLPDERLAELTNRRQMCYIREMDRQFLGTSSLIGSKALPDGLQGANETIGPNISRENGTRPSGDLSPGLLIGLTHDTERQGSTVNTLIVSSNGQAMFFEHRELVPEFRRITDQITRIAIESHQFERHLLTASADQQRYMWALYPFRLVDCAPNLVI